MDYGRPDLADRLAADYAVGTLRGGARRRFERLLLAHPMLAAATTDWTERLQVLAGQVAPVEPPAHVWVALQTRLFGAANDASLDARRAPGARRRLRFWQGLSAAALAASVVLAVMVTRPVADPAPIVVVMHSTPEGVALIKTGFVASVSADGRTLVLKPLGPIEIDAAHALELWAVPTTGAPRSLGVVAPNGQAIQVDRGRWLAGTKAFAVSLEPSGGSPTGAPTGPIVSAGGI